MIIHIRPNIGWISGKGMNEIKKMRRINLFFRINSEGIDI